jgi:hypothetical protein
MKFNEVYYSDELTESFKILVDNAKKILLKSSNIRDDGVPNSEFPHLFVARYKSHGIYYIPSITLKNVAYVPQMESIAISIAHPIPKLSGHQNTFVTEHYVHYLESDDITWTVDVTWTDEDGNLKPEFNSHNIVRLEYAMPDGSVDLTEEEYYKKVADVQNNQLNAVNEVSPEVIDRILRINKLERVKEIIDRMESLQPTDELPKTTGGPYKFE